MIYINYFIIIKYNLKYILKYNTFINILQYIKIISHYIYLILYLKIH